MSHSEFQLACGLAVIIFFLILIGFTYVIDQITKR